MKVSDSVLIRPRVKVFGLLLNTNVSLSRNCDILSIYFTAVRVFVCTVHFAELAGNRFATL